MADISAAVAGFDFQVAKNDALPFRSRFMDLFITGPNGVNQVGLSFEDRHDFVIGEQIGTYVEVSLPVSYLADIQYLLRTSKEKNLEITYDPVTGAISNFCLKSVNQSSGQ